MTALAYACVDLHGWCVPCRAGGRLVPAVDAGLQACQSHVRVLPGRRVLAAGQLELAVAGLPAALWAGHDIGEQRECTDCAAAGGPRPRQGLSERTPGDPMPLCVPCWRSRMDRAEAGHGGRRRGLSPDEAGWVVELAEQLACETCRPQPSVVDLPPAAVAARRRRRRREKDRAKQRPRSRPKSRSRPRAGCWRCADALWVASLRAVHEVDQQAAAADVVRVDELQAAHAVAVRAVERARRRLEKLLVWRERVATVVAAVPRLVKTGSRGRLQLKSRAGSRARAWALTARYLALADADRQARGLSARGRPSQLPQVVAVMAVAASFEAGRNSMAGLYWTALFAGVAPRTVTNGWADTVRLGCTRRVQQGRILKEAERAELQRHRQRAVYDFVAPGRSEVQVDPRPYEGAAAQVLAELLERAVQLVDEHQAVVDAAVAEAAAVEAELLDARAWAAEQTHQDLALRAEVDPLWVDDAAQAAQVAKEARVRASRAACHPGEVTARIAVQRVDREAQARALRAVDDAFEQARRMTIFCYQPRRGKGEYFSSCLRFGVKDSAAATSPLAGGRRPNGRGAGQQQDGATRSTTRSVARPSTSQQPRTLDRVRPVSPARASRPAVMWWAKPLARALAERWAFLERYLDAAVGRGSDLAAARERGLRIRMIAAVLGSRLGPAWTAHDVVRLVERFAGIHSVIAPGDAHSPLRYLAVMLDRALLNPDAVVPHRSPIRQAFERERLVAELAAEAARSAAIATDRADRAAAAAAERTGAQTARMAARAAAAGAGRSTPRPTQAGDPDDAARMAAAVAELARHPAALAEAARRGAGPAEDASGDGAAPADWQPAAPGSGLPASWNRHRDR